jgi:bacterial/archaeal transporter family-2 protein
LGGVAGAFAVVAGLLFVNKIGSGPYAALTIGATLIASVFLDQFGLIWLPLHTIGVWRGIGLALMMTLAKASLRAVAILRGAHSEQRES